MNERIKELMAEVGMSVDYLTNTKQIVLIEKFVELIVKECCNSFPHSGVGPPVTDYDRGYDDAIMSVIPYIKKHFGVEE